MLLSNFQFFSNYVQAVSVIVWLLIHYMMRKLSYRPCRVIPDLPPVDIAIFVRNRADFFQISTRSGNRETLVYDKQIMAQNSAIFQEFLRKSVSTGEDIKQLLMSKIDLYELKLMLYFFKNRNMVFNNVTEALKALNIAARFESLSFYIKCVVEIDALINIHNVLDIYKALYHFGDKSLQKSESGIKCFIDYFGRMLLENVFQFIDNHADVLLAMPSIRELRYEEFQMLMKRKTLRVLSERRFVDCLLDWAKQECLRQNINWNASNVLKTLGPLVMVPRYLQMKGCDFEYAYKSFDLSNFEEIKLLFEAYKKEEDDYPFKDITRDLRELLTRFFTARPLHVGRPFYLSRRSCTNIFHWLLVWSTESIELNLYRQFKTEKFLRCSTS